MDANAYHYLITLPATPAPLPPLPLLPPPRKHPCLQAFNHHQPRHISKLTLAG